MFLNQNTVMLSSPSFGDFDVKYCLSELLCVTLVEEHDYVHYDKTQSLCFLPVSFTLTFTFTG